MSQTLPPLFPIAPREYDPDEERAFRAKVATAIGERLGRDEVAPYGGVPHAAITGSDAAFSFPGTNVITIIPFNTLLRDGSPSILHVGNGFQLAYVMDITSFLTLYHSSGSGGNTTLTFYLYANAIEVYRTTRTTQLNDNETYQSTVFGKDLPAGVPLELGMSHTSNTAMIIDMTRSRWWIEQLTPDPRLVALERL